jgi:hypothetical protein
VSTIARFGVEVRENRASRCGHTSAIDSFLGVGEFVKRRTDYIRFARAAERNLCISRSLRPRARVGMNLAPVTIGTAASRIAREAYAESSAAATAWSW